MFTSGASVHSSRDTGSHYETLSVGIHRAFLLALRDRNT